MTRLATRPVLAVKGLSRTFAGVYALRDVTLAVRAGEITALLGENGAGKSTLIKILAGVYRPSAGAVMLDGARLGEGAGREAERHGLAFVHQDLGLLEDLSVAENLAFVVGFHRRAGVIGWRAVRRRAREILQRWAIDIDPDAQVASLDRGQRALVAIARAMATEARVVVFDEPTASLPASDADRLFDAIDHLAAAGVGVLYVTHRLGEVRRLADRAVVLRDGLVVGDVEVVDVTDEELVGLIVGREMGDLRLAPAHVADDVALRARNVSTGRAVDVSFDLRRGEILALAGLVGAGQRDIGRAAAGNTRPGAGEFELFDEPYAPRGPRHAQRRGVVYLPADRLAEGGFGTFDGTTNYVARDARTLALLRPRSERNAARAAFEDWKVSPADPDQVFEHFSGGNQQRILLAKWLDSEPEVLVADEPTAGVDIGAKAAIYQRLVRAAANGLAILLISSDFEEIATLAHRVLVFRDGRLVTEIQRDAASIDRVAQECCA